ncbi:MAG: hypothetical protein LBQ88_15375 [Treponema sp.]|jgi:hypothetical protein|nr:hypothetical protein [Treponema sp.]
MNVGNRLKRWNRQLILCALFLFALAPSLFAGGKAEAELSPADELINNKQYDEAINFLSNYLKKNPDKIELVQKRMNIIVEKKEEYYRLAEELLDTVENDWENFEKILALRSQLEEMEKSANFGNHQFLEHAQMIAQYKFFHKRLVDILDAGRNLLEQGNYTEAFVKYTEGLDMYQEDFFSAEFGDSVKTQVREDLEILSRDLKNFVGISPQTQYVSEAVKQEVLDPTAGGEHYGGLWQALGLLIAVKNDLVNIGSFFKTQESLLQTSDYEWENVPFLSFASQLVLGPNKEIAGPAQPPEFMQEGMLGAVDGLGNNFNQFFHKHAAEILDAGRDLLERGDYAAAFVKYTEGLDMYQENFFSVKFGDSVTTRVGADIETLNRNLKEFAEVSPQIRRVSDAIKQEALNRTAGSGFEGEHYDDLWAAADLLINIKNDLVNIGSFFKTQESLPQTSGYAWENVSFLSFASQFVFGPDREIAGPAQPPEYTQEGMLGAVDGLWNSLIPALTSVIIQDAEDVYAAGAASVIAGGDTEVTLGYLEAARELSLIPLELMVKRYQFRKPNQPLEDSVFGTTGLAADMPDYLKFTAINRSIDYLKNAFTLGRRYTDLMTQNFNSLEEWRTGRRTPDALMEREIDIQNSFISFYTDIDTYIEGLNAEIAGISTQEKPQTQRGYAEFISYINRIHGFIRNRRELAAAEELNSAVREYTIANGELQKRVLARQAELAEGKSNIEGKPYPLAGQSDYIAHYPREALDILNRMLASLSQDITMGKNLLAQYGGESQYILSDQRVQPLSVEAQALEAQLESIFAEGSSSAAVASARSAEADRHRQQGDEIYREAERILYRDLSDNDVDLARERLDNASAQYDASLAMQESAALRQERDTRIFELGLQIQERQNEIIIRQIRGWITEAQKIYMTGNFEQAIALLERAEERNLEINSTEDPEIVYWLNITRAALMLQSYQVITSTAPLYTEVSQLLSEARREYTEGVRLLRTRHNEGITLFNEARKKIEEVLLMFPVNKEAGVLLLRMDQVQNPETFEQQFKERFEKAVAEIDTKRAGATEAYTDLQNLAEIYPDYPGMRTVLDRAYRVFNPIAVVTPQQRRQQQASAQQQTGTQQQAAPVQRETAETARIRGLVASVRDVINRKNSASYQSALGQLNEVFQLDPTNPDYPNLKDALNRLIGAQGTITLDSVSESLYQKAIREFQQGNNLVAMSIVQQIKRMPGNEKNTRILQLERRIQSIL